MKTILVVDDSATMREMVAFVLQSAAHSAMTLREEAELLSRLVHRFQLDDAAPDAYPVAVPRGSRPPIALLRR